MKKIFNKIKEKVNIKLLAILPSLFLFTGCTRTGPKYLHIKVGLSNIGDFSEKIAESMEQLGLKVVQVFNGLFALLMRGFYYLPTGVGNLSIKNLESFSSFFKIITIVQVLALVYIIVCFAKSVASHNLMGQGSSTSTITHLKKIAVGLIATFLVPYLCITCYMASVYSASSLSSILKLGEDGTTAVWEIYDDMEKDGVSLGTYCKEGQELYGVSDLSDLSSPETQKDLNVPDDAKASTKYSVIPKDYKGGKYCDDTSRNIYEHFQHSQYKKTLIIGANTIEAGSMGSIINVELIKYNGLLMFLLGLAFTLVLGSIYVVFILSSFKRIIDLLMLIAMSWYYIGASVSDSPNENSLSSLWKKLFAICLTNFIMMLEFLIWVALVLDGDAVFTLPSLVYSVLWLLVLTATPTVVENMVVSTNTADSAAGMAQGVARSGFSRMMNR